MVNIAFTRDPGYTLDLDLPKATFFLPFERSGEKLMTAGLFSAFFNSGSYFCLFYIWIRSKAFRHLGSQFSQHTDLTGHCSRTRPKRPFRADFPVQRASKPVLSGRCPNRPLGSQFSQHIDLIGHCSRTRPERPFGRPFPSDANI